MFWNFWIVSNHFDYKIIINILNLIIYNYINMIVNIWDNLEFKVINSIIKLKVLDIKDSYIELILEENSAENIIFTEWEIIWFYSKYLKNKSKFIKDVERNILINKWILNLNKWELSEIQNTNLKKISIKKNDWEKFFTYDSDIKNILFYSDDEYSYISIERDIIDEINNIWETYNTNHFKRIFLYILALSYINWDSESDLEYNHIFENFDHILKELSFIYKSRIVYESTEIEELDRIRRKLNISFWLLTKLLYFFHYDIDSYIYPYIFDYTVIKNINLKYWLDLENNESIKWYYTYCELISNTINYYWLSKLEEPIKWLYLYNFFSNIK
jgi:hypothetical protein